MANLKDKAMKQVEGLINEVSELRTSLPFAQNKIDNAFAWQFMIKSIQIVKAICSEHSPHYQELNGELSKYNKAKIFDSDKWLGILQAVYDNLQYGMLSNVQELVAAEIFTDLSEMAEYLIMQGYQVPAVSIAGAILEDALRKVCVKNSITWDGASSISKLNLILYQNNVYDKAQFGQVDAWGKLRNKVDHHDFIDMNEIDVNDANRLVSGVRDFISRYIV